MDYNGPSIEDTLSHSEIISAQRGGDPLITECVRWSDNGDREEWAVYTPEILFASDLLLGVGPEWITKRCLFCNGYFFMGFFIDCRAADKDELPFIS